MKIYDLQTPLDFFVGKTGTSASTILIIIYSLRSLDCANQKGRNRDGGARGNSDRWLAQPSRIWNPMPQSAENQLFSKLL